MINIEWLNALEIKGLQTETWPRRNEVKRLALGRWRNTFLPIWKREKQVGSNDFLMGPLFPKTKWASPDNKKVVESGMCGNRYP